RGKGLRCFPRCSIVPNKRDLSGKRAGLHRSARSSRFESARRGSRLIGLVAKWPHLVGGRAVPGGERFVGGLQANRARYTPCRELNRRPEVGRGPLFFRAKWSGSSGR